MNTIDDLIQEYKKISKKKFKDDYSGLRMTYTIIALVSWILFIIFYIWLCFAPSEECGKTLTLDSLFQDLFKCIISKWQFYPMLVSIIIFFVFLGLLIRLQNKSNYYINRKSYRLKKVEELLYNKGIFNSNESKETVLKNLIGVLVIKRDSRDWYKQNKEFIQGASTILLILVGVYLKELIHLIGDNFLGILILLIICIFIPYMTRKAIPDAIRTHSSYNTINNFIDDLYEILIFGDGSKN